jgi:hypothetical protein
LIQFFCCGKKFDAKTGALFQVAAEEENVGRALRTEVAGGDARPTDPGIVAAETTAHEFHFAMITIRQALKELLQEQEYSAQELSQRLSIPEKEVYEHLQHVARAPGPGWRFRLTPAVCRTCGFTFAKRERLTIPSRCPVCRRQSLQRPRFALEPR